MRNLRSHPAVAAVACAYVEIENTLHSDAAWAKRRGVNLAMHSNWMHARLSMAVPRTVAGIYRRTRTLERDSQRSGVLVEVMLAKRNPLRTLDRTRSSIKVYSKVLSCDAVPPYSSAICIYLLLLYCHVWRVEREIIMETLRTFLPNFHFAYSIKHARLCGII